MHDIHSSCYDVPKPEYCRWLLGCCHASLHLSGCQDSAMLVVVWGVAMLECFEWL